MSMLSMTHIFHAVAETFKFFKKTQTTINNVTLQERAVPVDAIKASQIKSCTETNSLILFVSMKSKKKPFRLLFISTKDQYSIQ